MSTGCKSSHNGFLDVSRSNGGLNFTKSSTIPELKIALQQIWNDLPQTTINKAINDFRKRLNACTLAFGELYTEIF